jgi:hypothetical protein
MSNESIHEQTKKDLARLARDKGVPGWHAMRKDQLIRALSVPAAKKSNRNRPEPSGSHAPARSRGKFAELGTNGRHSVGEAVDSDRLALRPWHGRIQSGGTRDRLLAVARDPYWIHAYWEIGSSTVERARAAMGQLWHGSKPALRVMDVTSEDTSTLCERHERDEFIQSDANNWYVNIACPGKRYRVDLGFLSRRGSFFIVAKSNIVQMPPVSMSTSIEEDWNVAQQEIHRIQGRQNDPESQQLSNQLIELFEDRFHQPIHKTLLTHLPSTFLTHSEAPLKFEIDAEIVVYGVTNPTAKLTLQGEPVPIAADGSFSVRFHMPDSRQIIPAVASSADGGEEKTVILAVERNTKVMEPHIHDSTDY